MGFSSEHRDETPEAHKRLNSTYAPPDYQLPGAVLPLGETGLAVNRTVSAGLKRYVTFLLALGTGRLERFSGPIAE